MSKERQSGVLLTEILVAATVLGTILVVTATALGVSFDGMQSSKLQSNASFLLQEELEPLLTIRDKGWVGNMVNGTYYIAPAGSSWSLVPTVNGETIGQFTRKVTISDVYRDSNGQITEVDGTLDQSTKKAVATVSWQGFLPHTISATTYVTRYKDNLVWTQTNKADFDLGTKTGTVTQYTGGSSIDGEVVLGAGGQGDWCKPDLTQIQSLDIPGNGVGDAITAIEGRAFAGTGENASGTPFADITIPNTNPPVPQLRGTFNKNGTKTNAVFGESNYAYIATDTNSEEIVIVDISNPPNYTQAGSFDAPKNGNGNSVFVTGSYGYMTSSIDKKLYNFRKPGSTASIDTDGVVLDGEGKKVVVVGNYAYVAIDSTVKQLNIVDISNPTNLTKVGSFQIPYSGAGEGKDLFVNSLGTRVYLVTEGSSTQKEFFVIDTAQKNNPQLLGNYDTNGMDPKGVTVVTNNKAIVVGIGGEKYQVVDITNEASPTRCGGITTSYDIYGVSSILESDGDAYSYIITTDSKEFHVIQGGPGGAVATSGVFESSTIPVPDLTQQTAFNRFDATFNKPVGTDITFQVAVADVGGDGTCNTASFTFVGPDGTQNSSFSDDGVIPLTTYQNYKNPGRCFRYRATLTTSDTNKTPALYDFTINYSP